MVLNYATPNFIDGLVMEGDSVAWRLIGFHGELVWDDKHLSWSYLWDLHNNATTSWMIMGDFNDILVASEKEGGNIGPQQMMQSFRDCVDDFSLQEVYVIGNPFAWSRGMIRNALIEPDATKLGLRNFLLLHYYMSTIFSQKKT